ncbi:XdhC family protein [Gordonia sp. CPCC 205515]|uniref:XdhC family protein n=1 Tax=Gordonia sp. CPCC 205515 TaxID=3140791 RepID=UPI003AF3403F
MWQSGRSCALATVVATNGSSPRDPGAMLVVHEDGSVEGSISGGCVEGALYESALDVLSTGTPRIEDYGPAGDLIAPGLTCGGSLRVLVEKVSPGAFPHLGSIVEGLCAGKSFTLTTAVRTNGCEHDLLEGILGATRIRSDTVTRVFEPPPRMVIVGSTDFAAELSALGARLGYLVTVCDARPVFTTPARLPDAHRVVCEWPSDFIARERDSGCLDSRTVVVVLTHDPKIDVPVLVECLDDARWMTPPFYVGAMGSRTADARRRRELADAGITIDQCARLSSPVGLPIGNRGPAQTAVSIAAELVTRLADQRQMATGTPEIGVVQAS